MDAFLGLLLHTLLDFFFRVRERRHALDSVAVIVRGTFKDTRVIDPFGWL